VCSSDLRNCCAGDTVVTSALLGLAMPGFTMVASRSASFVGSLSGSSGTGGGPGDRRERDNTERATAPAGGGTLAGAGAAAPGGSSQYVVVQRVALCRRGPGRARAGLGRWEAAGWRGCCGMSQCGVGGTLFSRACSSPGAALAGVRGGAMLHELELVEAGVEAAALHVHAVGPLCEDRAPVEDEDAVGVLDRGEAVGDDDGVAATHEGVERVLDLALEGGIQGAGGIVEDEDEGVEGQGPCERGERELADGTGE